MLVKLNNNHGERKQTPTSHFPKQKKSNKTKESSVIYVEGRAIREARVTPPSHPLVWRKLSGSLTFEEENGFGESVFVVVVVEVVTLVDATKSRRRRRGEATGKKQKENHKCGDEARRRDSKRHFSLLTLTNGEREALG